MDGWKYDEFMSEAVGRWVVGWRDETDMLVGEWTIKWVDFVMEGWVDL
jgi:hypothetical protein